MGFQAQGNGTGSGNVLSAPDSELGKAWLQGLFGRRLGSTILLPSFSSLFYFYFWLHLIACGIFPNQGSNLRPLLWKHRVLGAAREVPKFLFTPLSFLWSAFEVVHFFDSTLSLLIQLLKSLSLTQDRVELQAGAKETACPPFSATWPPPHPRTSLELGSELPGLVARLV